MTEYQKLTRHVFVCTNERPAGHPRGCCKSKGSEQLLQDLKLGAARAGLGKTVRVQKSGCLDVCESGPALVVYPEGVWYGGVTQADTQELVQEHLVNGRPVDRLRIPTK